MDGHSSGTPVAGRLARPTRRAMREPMRGPKPPAHPIRSCSRWGLPCRPCHQGRGALLPHPFTLAADDPPLRAGPVWRFTFCGTFPGVAPAGRYPAPCSRGARTFLPPHLSDPRKAAIRPSDGLYLVVTPGTGKSRVKSGGQSGGRMGFSPVARQVTAPANPHPVMGRNVIENTMQGDYAPGPPQQTRVQANS